MKQLTAHFMSAVDLISKKQVATSQKATAEYGNYLIKK